MARTPIHLRDLNAAERDAFVEAIGWAFEGSPWIAAEAWPGRPFAGPDQLHRALCAVLQGASLDRKLSLIRAHPDLVGRAALAGTLTPESRHEQAAAGLGSLSSEDVAAFTRLNAAYRRRFGFPFVICARENKKEAILAAFPVRLEHTRDEEIETALDEIAKIARLRLIDAVSAE